MIKGNTDIELVSSFGGTIGGSPGSGKFTVSSDRMKLAPVLSSAVKHKLLSLLKCLNLQEYRRSGSFVHRCVAYFSLVMVAI